VQRRAAPSDVPPQDTPLRPLWPTSKESSTAARSRCQTRTRADTSLRGDRHRSIRGQFSTPFGYRFLLSSGSWRGPRRRRPISKRPIAIPSSARPRTEPGLGAVRVCAPKSPVSHQCRDAASRHRRTAILLASFCQLHAEAIARRDVISRHERGLPGRRAGCLRIQLSIEERFQTRPDASSTSAEGKSS
jgi:hypothetical protein